MRNGKFYLVTLLLFFTLFIFFTENQKASAANIEYQATWAIHVDFVGNQPNATLTVRVHETDNGSLTVHTTNHALSCTVPASVSIANNEATFDGSDGILCRIPSLRIIVYQMTDGKFILPNECDCKDGAFAQAQVALDANLSGQVQNEPIFTMKDLAMEAQMLPDTSFTARTHFSVDDQTAVSEAFTIHPFSNSLFARFLQNSLDPNDLSYQPLFSANGENLAAFPPHIEEDLALSYRQRRLYIGYSPFTNEGLNGRLTSLDIDPGCFGTGGG